MPHLFFFSVTYSFHWFMSGSPYRLPYRVSEVVLSNSEERIISEEQADRGDDDAIFGSMSSPLTDPFYEHPWVQQSLAIHFLFHSVCFFQSRAQQMDRFSCSKSRGNCRNAILGYCFWVPSKYGSLCTLGVWTLWHDRTQGQCCLRQLDALEVFLSFVFSFSLVFLMLYICRFSDKQEVERAMTKHGKKYHGNMMIGVLPCNDPVQLSIYLLLSGSHTTHTHTHTHNMPVRHYFSSSFDLVDVCLFSSVFVFCFTARSLKHHNIFLDPHHSISICCIFPLFPYSLPHVLSFSPSSLSLLLSSFLSSCLLPGLFSPPLCSVYTSLCHCLSLSVSISLSLDQCIRYLSRWLIDVHLQNLPASRSVCPSAFFLCLRLSVCLARHLSCAIISHFKRLDKVLQVVSSMK